MICVRLRQYRQHHAFCPLIEATGNSVDWACEVSDELSRILVEGDNRQRAIPAQVLSILAKSDPRELMLKDLAVLLN